MTKKDILSICSLTTGLALAFSAGTPAAAALDTVTFGHGNYVLAALGLASIVASQVIRVLSVPAVSSNSANPPAQGGPQA